MLTFDSMRTRMFIQYSFFKINFLFMGAIKYDNKERFS